MCQDTPGSPGLPWLVLSSLLLFSPQKTWQWTHTTEGCSSDSQNTRKIWNIFPLSLSFPFPGLLHFTPGSPPALSPRSPASPRESSSVCPLLFCSTSWSTSHQRAAGCWLFIRVHEQQPGGPGPGAAGAAAAGGEQQLPPGPGLIVAGCRSLLRP